MVRWLILLALLITTPCQAAVLVQSANGQYSGAYSTLAAAAVATGVTNVVVTSALSAVQSNISSASLHAWPPGRALEVKKGGSIGNTTTFTINGPFTAGLYQVFSGSGTVKFGDSTHHPKTVLFHPEWWGANADDLDASATINRVALQAALDCVKAPGNGKYGTVELTGGVYRIDDYITVPFGMTLQGQGTHFWSTTTLWSTSNKTKDVLVIGTDGFVGSRAFIKKLMVSNGRYGIYGTDISYLNLTDVIAKANDTGMYLIDALMCSFTNVECTSNVTGLKMLNNNNSNSNLNDWRGCKFIFNTGDGAVITRSKANSWYSCQFEQNGGWGLKIDDNYPIAPNVNWPLWSYGFGANGGNTFIGGWFEGNNGGAIYLKDTTGTLFQTVEIQQYTGEAANGYIKIENTKGVRFESCSYFAWSPIGEPKKIYIDHTSINNHIDIHSQAGNGEVVDDGIGTTFGANTHPAKKDNLDFILSNVYFQVPGSNSTTDKVASWDETDTGGKISLDPDDLIYPRELTQYSIKVAQGATPTPTSIYQTTPAKLGPAAAYYLHITYKCDTANSNYNGYMSAYWTNVTGAWTSYDFVSRTYAPVASNPRFALPMSMLPVTIVIPVKTDVAAALYQLKLTWDNGIDNVNSVFHVYSAFVSKYKDVNPRPEWAAAPTSGTWELRDKLPILTPLAAGSEGWVCVTAGTYGTLTGITGSITSGTAVLTVNDASTLKAGQYIAIAGVTGVNRILGISGVAITLDSNAGATVTGAAVGWSPPVFKTFGAIGA